MREQAGHSQAVCLEKFEHLRQLKTLLLSPATRTVSGHDLGLSDTVAVTEHFTDLRGSSTLTRQLADLLDNLLGGGLDPCRGGAGVREGGGRYALSVGVKTTHCCEDDRRGEDEGRGTWSWRRMFEVQSSLESCCDVCGNFA